MSAKRAAAPSLRPRMDSPLIGASVQMRAIRDQLRRLAPTSLTVTLEGPSGSGKELAAMELHRQSGRKGAFVPMNVSAVPDSLFDSIFFGHMRGAFTGADSAHDGLLAQANHGTLFLDEIGTLSPSGQAKLLRALELRSYRPVGAAAERTSCFRLVVASNTPIVDLACVGQFRSDLRHRFGLARVTMPALRDHWQDIPLLAQHFLRTNLTGRRSLRFSAEAMRLLERYEWPGNVRELRAVVELTTALAPEGVVSRDQVAAALSGDLASISQNPGGASGNWLSAGDLKEALVRTGGVVRLAAQHLGISRSHFYRLRSRVERDSGLSSRDSAGDEGDTTGDTARGQVKHYGA